MLGMSKWFVAFLFIAIVIGYGTKNWMNAVSMMAVFIVIRVVWRFLVN